MTSFPWPPPRNVTAPSLQSSLVRRSLKVAKLPHSTHAPIRYVHCQRREGVPVDARTLITGAVDKFAEDLKSNYGLEMPGQPEDQLKGPVSLLLTTVGSALGLVVATKTESPVAGLGGRPDIGVAVTGLLAGHVELKAPGFGARTSTFKGENQKQWQKFKALPNLIYTDGNEWALYRSGELIGKVVKFALDITEAGHEGITDANISDLTELIRLFIGWQPIVPSSPKALAELLAPLCRLLRTDVLASVKIKGSAMSLLAAEWRTYLFHDSDDFQFADAYAQTLTYALLLARFEGVTDLRHQAADALDAGHGLLAQVLRVLGQPAAREEIRIPLDLLERSISAVQPKAVAKLGDPWLYFYEDFLAAYDEKLRKNRGVYYTPAQVVNAQISLLTEILANQFNKPLGMADDDVIVLDPAVGTGTYLLAALQHSLSLVSEKYGPGAVASRATTAGANLHGFELLVGPYSVAHLRLSEQILASQGQLPPDGAHVYLTDTLESPNEPHGQMTFDLLHKRLTEENKRAREIKAHKRVLVCVGNPPYYRQVIEPGDEGTERQGGWVRNGDHGNDGILNDFLKPVIDAGMGVHAKNLYNLYVYFWRWALWKVFDSTESHGIVSFISASSYLRGPGFVGMREAMRRTFDEMWILDLEGGNLGARKTENVFAIQNPVAIAIGVRYGKPRPEESATVHYAKLEGSREDKLETLASIKVFADVTWQDCFNGWQEPLVPVQSGNYFSWPLLTNIFPWQHSGSQFKRTWPIAPDSTTLSKRWLKLVKSAASQRKALFHESRDRRVDKPYAQWGTEEGKSLKNFAPIATLTADAAEPAIVRYGYRSFDRQWAMLDNRLGDFLRPQLWGTQSDKQIYLTSLITGTLGPGPAATVCGYVPDLHHFRGSYGGKDVIPLWRDAQASHPNITSGFLQTLSEILGRNLVADELFAYTYAVLGAPSYVDRFSEELTIPGPRIPITAERDFFDRAVGLGSRLIWLHTFGERFLSGGPSGKTPVGRARCVKAVPEDKDHYPETVTYDETMKSLHIGEGTFEPVDAATWNFSVSGFVPVQSWIAYRLAGGAGRHSSALDDLRPETWTAPMTEELLHLLWVIEETLRMGSELDNCLQDILSGLTVRADELPMPNDAERTSSGEAEPEAQGALGEI